MAIAEIKHLKKVYPTFTLTDVSFDLNAGRITGFIGRNGAGKTTTIKVMLGLAHSDLGQVSYFRRKRLRILSPLQNPFIQIGMSPPTGNT